MDGITTITIDMNTVQSGTRIDFLYTLDEVNNATGDLYIYDNEGGLTYLENTLPAVTIYSNLTARFNGGIIQSSVYWNSKYYEAFRDKQNTKALDDFQDGLDWMGTVPLIGEPVDFINAGISAARGNKLQAGLSLAAMVPVGGWIASGYKITSKSDNIVKVFRVYGGESTALGKSWSPVNPNSVENFRDLAGLPDVNTGRFVIEGTVNKADIILERKALPLDGNKGGLTEYIIDATNINIINVSGVNPHF